MTSLNRLPQYYLTSEYPCSYLEGESARSEVAVPYNLMHILIDDGVAEPGNWWYPSPFYVADGSPRTGNGRPLAAGAAR